MIASPKLSIVIVNWNTGPELRSCLRSIALATDKVEGQCEVVVVDNHSSDDSMQGLEVDGLPLQLVLNNENRGFGAACNQGARLAHGETLLFLNPDTRLQEDSLAVPLAFLARPEQADVGVCSIQLLRPDGTVSRDCWRFPTLGTFCRQILGLDHLKSQRAVAMTDWDHGQTRQVDHVIGAFYMVRREVYEALQGFDERFFVYFEDLDFSRRTHLLGWRTVYLASARACHIGGVSSGKVRATRLFYSLRSRFQYAFKHWSAPQAWALVALSLLVEPFTRTAWCLLRGQGTDVGNTLRGYGMVYRQLPSLLRQPGSAK